MSDAQRVGLQDGYFGNPRRNDYDTADDRRMYDEGYYEGQRRAREGWRTCFSQQ